MPINKYNVIYIFFNNKMMPAAQIAVNILAIIQAIVIIAIIVCAIIMAVYLYKAYKCYKKLNPSSSSS